MFNKRQIAQFGLLLVLAGSSTGSSTEQDDVRTGVFINGRGWKELPATAKLFYSMGVSNGLYYASIVTNTPGLEVMGRTGLPHDQAVEAIDRFYQDPANTWIPVNDAMLIIRMTVEIGRAHV